MMEEKFLFLRLEGLTLVEKSLLNYTAPRRAYKK